MTRDMPPLLEATERRAGPRQRIAALWPSPAWLVVALIVMGAVTRFYHLGSRSLWLDETHTAQSVRSPTLGGVMTWTYGDPDQMPLMNLLAWMLRGFGGSEWSVRLPSALAGTLEVLAIYCLATTLFRPRVGLVAALLAAILPFSVSHPGRGTCCPFATGQPGCMGSNASTSSLSPQAGSGSTCFQTERGIAVCRRRTGRGAYLRSLLPRGPGRSRCGCAPRAAAPPGSRRSHYGRCDDIQAS
jgi:hypothetical protein